MKRLYLLLILIAFCFQLSAQDNYRPFVEEGKTWNYYVKATTNWWDEADKQIHYDIEYENATLTIKGDTVVDGKEYKKVIYSSDNTFFYDTDFTYGIIREENKKVYMRFFFDDYYDPEFPLSEEVLMYDFGLNVGDSFVENYGVDDIWMMNMELMSKEEKNNRRVFTFSADNKFSYNNNENPMMIWVEGAGGYHSLGLKQRIQITTCMFCTRYTILSISCYLGDECLCAFDENCNLVSGIEGVKTDVDKDKSVYDLQGRRLNAEPERGLYIKDGKKIAR